MNDRIPVTPPINIGWVPPTKDEMRSNKRTMFLETDTDLPSFDMNGFSDTVIAERSKREGMTEDEWLESVNGFRLNIPKYGT